MGTDNQGQEEELWHKEIHTMGVLTSGGDAPGMNAAIRAVVRRAITSGRKVKGIKKGYNGLLNEEIVDMDVTSVSDIISGAEPFFIPQDVREFVTPEGQKEGAEICRKHGIDGLIVIGGDGSFRGRTEAGRSGHQYGGHSGNH